MKTLFTLLLATLCAATGYGQTIKTLGYNTTNGVVAYSGMNTLTFTNGTRWNGQLSSSDLGADNLTIEGAIYFTDAVDTNGIATTRTNLGLGATWLTNTNATNFRSAIGLGVTNDVTLQTVTATTGEGVTLMNAGLEGWGNAIYLEERLNQYGTNTTDVWTFSSGLAFLNSGAAVTRTNVGLPLPALTNTSNVTAMRALSGSTNTNHPYSGSVSLTNTNVLVFSNGILQSVQ